MTVYVLYLIRDLALSPAVIGLIFGFGGGAGVLLGSASAGAISRRFGIGRTLVVAHVLFGLFGLPLALAIGLPWLAAPLVFVSEFTQLSVNAVYMVSRTSVEQALTPHHLQGRVQGSRTVSHALAGTLGLIVGGVLGERFGTSVAVSVGVFGGLISFVWLWRSPIRQLQQFSDVAG